MMWPKSFEYVRVSSVDEALKLLDDNYDAKILAGGHSLLPAMKLRLSDVEQLVDIGHISELKSISFNGNLSIGALSTHSEIALSPEVQRHCPVLATAASKIGDPAVRNFGTLGGNIAHADPASDPPPVLVACDAVIHLQSLEGTRQVIASDFFIDLFTTALEPGEIVTRIEIPDLSNSRSAYMKLAHPASRYAVVGVCVVLTMHGDTCTSASVGVGGATVAAMKSESAAQILAGSNLDGATLDAAATALQDDIEDMLTGDIGFPEDYRQSVAGAFLKRAVRAALT